jgi:hypothetical protein
MAPTGSSTIFASPVSEVDGLISVLPPAEAVTNSVRPREPVNIRKFAGWEGRFTPAHDS